MYLPNYDLLFPQLDTQSLLPATLDPNDGFYPYAYPEKQPLLVRRNLYATWSRSPGSLRSNPWLGRLFSPATRSPRRNKTGDPRFGRLFSPVKESPKQGVSGVGGHSPPTPSRRIPTPKRIIFRDFDVPPNIVFLGYRKRSYLQGKTKRLARETWAIRRFFSLDKRKPTCSSRAKPLRASYHTCQLLWRKKRKDLVNLILLGGLPHCKIPKEEIETYYTNIWSTTRAYKGLGQFGNLPAADNVPFQNPITCSEVLMVVKRMMAKSSPGPDGIRRPHLLLHDRRGIKLARLFNMWLVSGYIPKIMKGALTTLIPKSSDETAVRSLKNWRPISKGCWKHAPPHSRQRGFAKGPGCAENILIIDRLHSAAKSRARSLGAAFIDLSKAFDSVSHQLIFEVLERKGVDQLIINVVRSAYSGACTMVKTLGGSTAPIPILSGVKQGDPLSPILFNLALDPFMYLLEREVVGVQFGKDLSISSIAYADDLVLLGESYSDLQKSTNVLSVFLNNVGLIANPAKCHSFVLNAERGRVHLNPCPPLIFQGEEIQLNEHGELIQYLGILVDPWKGIVAGNPKDQLEDLISKVGAARLKPSQKVTLLRQYILPKIIYVCDHSNVGVSKLSEMDRLVRNALKKWLHLESHVTDGLFYSKHKDGGLNIPRLSQQIVRIQLKSCGADTPVSGP
ncbi:hypothetical protein WMY93_029749 [Mugilogobius chulae]|uniref:Reverse transcriptase domain-containing protein n=1 Tax=Mugilogobius chulae TaxID=88201 RepID=A0AAW0MLW2_9GOBI